MLRKFILPISFLLIAPITLLSSVFLFQYSFDKNNHFQFSKPLYRMYQALPATTQILDNISALNVRIESIEKFLSVYNSPLTPHAEFIVETSDKYGIDHRLLPALAMQESNLCKKIPQGSYNCWGYGIYGGKILSFNGYREAIETVAGGLAQDYIAQGLDTPSEIMSKYTPSNTGGWALAVSYFMEQLKIF